MYLSNIVCTSFGIFRDKAAIFYVEKTVLKAMTKVKSAEGQQGVQASRFFLV